MRRIWRLSLEHNKIEPLLTAISYLPLVVLSADWQLSAPVTPLPMGFASAIGTQLATGCAV